MEFETAARQTENLRVIDSLYHLHRPELGNSVVLFTNNSAFLPFPGARKPAREEFVVRLTRHKYDRADNSRYEHLRDIAPAYHRPTEDLLLTLGATDWVLSASIISAPN